LNEKFRFDVMLSFAGAEREYARAIYKIASANGLKVFLDEEFQPEIWGKNLVEYLDAAYRESGCYVLALLSRAYCDNVYARVERRAAFDRMINETGEYFLPVKVDDSWIDGLPKSTAYLDLRTTGVLGVCEILIQKIIGTNSKLNIPPEVFIPRIPFGRLSSEHLETYLLDICKSSDVVLFGVLIYDERCADVKKLLRDQDYWDALDKASGPDFEIFAIRDIEESEVERTMELMTAQSNKRSYNKMYFYSSLLKEYFKEEKTRLAYPSLLLFIVEKKEVKYCRLIPLGRKDSITGYFNNLIDLFTSISTELKATKGMPVSDVWERLKTKLLNEKYTLYIQTAPRNANQAIQSLLKYIDN